MNLSHKGKLNSHPRWMEGRKWVAEGIRCGKRGQQRMRMEMGRGHLWFSWRPKTGEAKGSLWAGPSCDFYQQGDIEPEMATSYSQTRFTVEGVGTPNEPQNLQPKFVLHTRCTGIKTEPRLRERPTND